MKILVATDAWHPQVNGVVRTLDRHAATIVALVARDFLADAHAIIADLQGRVGLQVIEAPPEAGEDWLIKLLR